MNNTQATGGKTSMARLLSQVDAIDNGRVFIEYHQQWPTFFRAQDNGYIDADGYITEKGREAGAQA